MRYTGNLGCRYKGIPHDLMIIHENPRVKWEKCKICSKRFRWNKGYKGRIKNTEYLKAHVREYAQPNGATKRIFNKIYQLKNCTITI